jgi:hypothetical protein
LIGQFSNIFMSCGHLKVAVMAPANGHVLHLAAFKIASWDSHMAWQAKCACACANCHNEGGGPQIMALQNISNSYPSFLFFCKYGSIFFQTEKHFPAVLSRGTCS